MEGAGDDQVFNRMLTCWIDDSAEQDDRVLVRILLRDLAPPEDQDRESPEVLTCQAIWEIVGRQMFFVTIPFATRIRFLAHSNRRNPEMLLDLIKAHAVLRFMQREQSHHGPLLCLTATRDDFNEAVRLYGLLNGTAGGQETKLTRKESDLIDVIVKHSWPEFTIPQLQKETGWSNSTLHRLIHGYESRGSRYTGLLEKCPALSFCDRTVVTDEEAAGSRCGEGRMPTCSTRVSTGRSLGGRSGSMTMMTLTILQHFSSPSAILQQVLKDSKTNLRASIRLRVPIIKIYFLVLILPSAHRRTHSTLNPQGWLQALVCVIRKMPKC